MHPASLREQAEYLRLGLAMAVIANDAVVAWADRNILVLDDPPIEVIEVSLAGKVPHNEMMQLLGSVPGRGDLTLVAHQLLGLLREGLVTANLTLETVLDMISAYRVWASIPEVEAQRAEWFFEALYLAEVGAYGTLKSVREEVLTFLDEYASLPSIA